MKTSRQQKRRLTSWGIPLAYVVATLVVGIVLPRVEHRLLPGPGVHHQCAVGHGGLFLDRFGMIALTGIVFSLAFVMVQFSATAYSPRLVLWVARDPVVSHALGVFTATFLYSLLLLAWVDREAARARSRSSVRGWFFVLLLASVGMFIALIERLGMLQVNRMLIFTGDQGRKAIEELYLPAKVHPDPAAAGPANCRDCHSRRR